MSWGDWSAFMVCAFVAVGGHFAVSSRGGGAGVRRSVVAPRLRNGNGPAGPARASRDDTAFSRNRTICRSNLRSCRWRTRIRRFAPSSSQNAVRSSSAGRLPLSVSGVIVAPSESVAPAILLGPKTTRGPPGGGAQCPRRFDGAGDRPALRFWSTPPPSEFHLLPASRRPAQLFRLAIGFRAHGVTRPVSYPWWQYQNAPAAQSIAAQPFPPKGCHECQMFLPRQQNSASENYHEHASQFLHA